LTTFFALSIFSEQVLVLEVLRGAFGNFMRAFDGIGALGLVELGFFSESLFLGEGREVVFSEESIVIRQNAKLLLKILSMILE
jgi:hypothetical protein